MFRNLSTPVVIGLAAAAVLAALTLQTKTPSPPTDAPQAGAPKGTDTGDLPPPRQPKGEAGNYPLAPVYHFLGAEREGNDNYLWPSRATLRGYTIQCLIVTVPHPVKAGMGYWYDLTLEAIERAFENAEFVLDRAQIPAAWRSSTTGAAALATADDLPGVLLFRRPEVTEHTRQLGVVFLVPETPTGGLAIKTFRQSVHLIRSLDSVPNPADNLPSPLHPRTPTQNKFAKAQCGASDVRVVGPFFSGSEASLNLALQEAVADDRDNESCTIRIYNGSATGIKPSDFPATIGATTIEYHTTVIPDRIVMDWLTRFLNDPSNPPTARPLAKIALLKEADTSYGSSVLRPGSPQKAIGRPGQVIEIPFPIHLSALQGAHTKELQDQLARLGLPRSAGGIPIPQEEGEKEGDIRTSVPAQSPLTTAAINDLLIKNILSTISRERIRYVGLAATDPRDKILLATLIRQNCPDVRLFTTGGDYLLAHPDFSTAVSGMIVGSTYPLDAEPQRFARTNDPTANDRRVLFANQSFQGCFNAVLAHLADSDSRDKKNSPLRSLNDRLLGYDSLHEATADRPAYRTPTVWISVIGQNSTIVPVYKVAASDVADDLERARVLQHNFAPDAEGEEYEPSWRPPPPPTYSTYWLCCLIVASAAVVWVLVRYLGQIDAGHRPGANVQRFCLAGAFFILVGLYGWVGSLALLAWDPSAADLEVLWPTVVDGAVIALCAFMIALASYYFGERCLWDLWPTTGTGTGTVRRRQVGPLLVHLIVLVLAVILLVWEVNNARWGWTGDNTHILYFERVTHFLSGMSPILPAFLLGSAVVAWCFFIHKEYRLLARNSVENPFAVVTATDGPYDRLPSLDDQLRTGLRTYGFCWQGRPTAGAAHWRAYLPQVVTPLAPFLLLLVFVQMLSRWIPTIEGMAFDVALYAGLLLVALLIVHTLGHFYFTWRRLQQLLHELAWLPLAAAFQRLPAKVKQTFDRNLYAQRPGHSALEFIEDQKQLLLGKLAAAADSMATRLKELTGKDTTLLADFRTAPTFLNCLRLLRPFWEGRPLGDRYSAAPEKADRTTTKEAVDAWVEMAEDFLAIHITLYLSQFFVHLRNLLNALTIGTLLLLLTISMYPFQPQGLLFVYAVVLLAATGAVAVLVLVGINRDEIMSHLAGSTPNRFTPDLNFTREMVQYVLPVAGLLMVQFPAVGSVVRSVLEPLLRVMH